MFRDTLLGSDPGTPNRARSRLQPALPGAGRAFFDPEGIAGVSICRGRPRWCHIFLSINVESILNVSLDVVRVE